MPHKQAHTDHTLQKDVVCMLRDAHTYTSNAELARHIIVVVRERVLREIEQYARENVR